MGEARLGAAAGGGWRDVPGLAVVAVLPAAARAVISYTVNVDADKAALPGGDAINSGGQGGLGDFLGGRVTIDGVPYRQSGSHVSPLGAAERSSQQLRGVFAVRVPAGNRSIRVQWRRWGAGVRAWRSAAVSAAEGYASSRFLHVSAAAPARAAPGGAAGAADTDAAVAFAQPLGVARLNASARSGEAWAGVPGLALALRVPARGWYALRYLLHVRPDSAPNANPLLGRDTLSARLAVDGAPLRESTATFATVSRTYASGSLVGWASALLEPGAHAVEVQWVRGGGGGVLRWWSAPTFLDGFTAARTLLATRSAAPLLLLLRAPTDAAALLEEPEPPLPVGLALGWRAPGAGGGLGGGGLSRVVAAAAAAAGWASTPASRRAAATPAHPAQPAAATAVAGSLCATRRSRWT